jgi:hypothetical protein
MVGLVGLNFDDLRMVKQHITLTEGRWPPTVTLDKRKENFIPGSLDAEAVLGLLAVLPTR